MFLRAGEVLICGVPLTMSHKSTMFSDSSGKASGKSYLKNGIGLSSVSKMLLKQRPCGFNIKKNLSVISLHYKFK